MTVPFDAARPEEGALGVYGAVGDALAGRPKGFGRRRAALAARFARHRAVEADAVAASWYAGLLAEAGHVCVVVPAGADERRRTLALADAPLYGARIIAAIPGIPAHAGDVVRWHREHDDGTGFPDRLRWDGIPPDAAALGIVDAFLAAIEDPLEPCGPAEALFAIIGENGRRFNVELVRAFREFVTQGGAEDEARAETIEGSFDDTALLASLAEKLDERATRTTGRSGRVAALARALASHVGADAEHAARLGHLTALGNAVTEPSEEAFDPLSRFARDRRAAAAQHASELLGEVGAYAADGELLVRAAEWHADRGPDLLAGIVGLAFTVDSMDPHDAPRLVAAASGKYFDPAVAEAYVAGVGAPT
ncbi:MAG TPA: HD domain-containing phosphohydrolase [Candidatus Elarobacter sp.]